MKNKKAELLAPETLKIIISIVCILILVYLLFAIYYATTNKQDLAKAKSTMDEISKSIDKSNQDPSYTGVLTTLTPGGWFIFSYTGSNKKPNSCAGQNCLCICDEVWVDNLYLIKDRQLNECSDDGTCIIVKNLKDFGKIEIREVSKPTSIKIFKKDNLIEVQEI